VPSICLTRRGNLKTKLDAFAAAVDDILSVPFAPEQLVARILAVLRRSYSDAVTFTPVIRLVTWKSTSCITRSALERLSFT
jgi:DNA-binding response OmpR family regulator